MSTDAILDEIEGRTNDIGRWPTNAEIGLLRHDNEVLVRVIRNILDTIDAQGDEGFSDTEAMVRILWGITNSIKEAAA